MDKGVIDAYVVGGQINREELYGKLLTAAAVTYMQNHNVTDDFKRASRRVKFDKDRVIRGKSFLIVEDNEMGGELLVDILEGEGGEVSWAKTIVEAGIQFKKKKFDLAICDLMLPRISGPEAIRVLNTSILKGETPVMVISAFSEPGLVEACYREGLVDFLVKPIEPQELVQRICNVFEPSAE